MKNNQPLIQWGKAETNDFFPVTFPEAYSSPPAVSLTLQNGSYTGTFGNMPSVVSLDTTSMEVNPGNTGAIVHWIAVGNR